jgi:radical SAM protein with 4Fe4S-binding SPASM domain
MVVRPDTVDSLPAGIEFLRRQGVRRIEPSLDVWTDWSEEDIARLEKVVAKCAQIWRAGLPFVSIGWFDEKAAQLAKLPRKPAPRCGFGRGEITVAVSGRMYPCERLVGDDAEDNPMALPGHVLEGDDFLNIEVPSEHPEHACGQCAMLAMCSTFCRCSNYVRTGNTRRPDLLLCAWNQACLNETAKIVHQSLLITQPKRKEELSCDLNERTETAVKPRPPHPGPCVPTPC